MGANLGDPVAQLGQAIARLAAFAEVEAVSSVYRSEPVGLREQPDFFNLVCMVRTTLSPPGLLAATQNLEAALGRRRTTPDAPRTLDIDILAWDHLVLRSPELTLPHPRMHQRAFVLVPLAEIAPEWRHPVLGATAEELLGAASVLERIERWGPLPASD